MSTSGIRQFASFAAIGVVNTAIYYAVYVTVNRWAPYLAAHAVGYAVAMCASFLLNSYITLRAKPTWLGFARFPLSGAVNVVASGIMLHLAVIVLDMDENLAALAAGLLATPLSFLVARWAITAGRPSPPPATGTVRPRMHERQR